MARHAYAAAGAEDKGTGEGCSGEGLEGYILGYAWLDGGDAGSCVGCVDKGGGGGVERG